MLLLLTSQGWCWLVDIIVHIVDIGGIAVDVVAISTVHIVDLLTLLASVLTSCWHCWCFNDSVGISVDVIDVDIFSVAVVINLLVLSTLVLICWHCCWLAIGLLVLLLTLHLLSSLQGGSLGPQGSCQSLAPLQQPPSPTAAGPCGHCAELRLGRTPLPREARGPESFWALLALHAGLVCTPYLCGWRLLRCPEGPDSTAKQAVPQSRGPAPWIHRSREAAPERLSWFPGSVPLHFPPHQQRPTRHLHPQLWYHWRLFTARGPCLAPDLILLDSCGALGYQEAVAVYILGIYKRKSSNLPGWEWHAHRGKWKSLWWFLESWLLQSIYQWGAQG